MAKLKTYVGGPMRGYPKWNFPAFDKAAAFLKTRGFDPISPADLDREAGFDENNPESDDSTVAVSAMMRRDIEALLKVDAIHLLPGWEKSSGANFELIVARWLGLQVYEFKYGWHAELDHDEALHNCEYWLIGMIESSAMPHAEPLLRSFKHPEPEETPGTADDFRPDPDNREDSILGIAYSLVHGDRGADYGHPIDDFTRTATIWTAILGRTILPHEVAMCMIGVKLSRLVQSPKKRDHAVDIAGYAETLDMVITRYEELGVDLTSEIFLDYVAAE